jgi:hypothetical protein
MTDTPEQLDVRLMSPYFSDGGHGTELGRISPDGNVFGAKRIVREWLHYKWWTGQEYADIEIAGRADSYAELPINRPWGEIWQIPSSEDAAKWNEYYYDAEEEAWTRLQWFWTVDGLSALPTPGIKVGGAHVVKETNVQVMWTGYQWERIPKHSGLLDDEPDRHLPRGFLQIFTPDVRVTYYSSKEIGLAAMGGGSGKVWVNGLWIDATRECSLWNRLAVIDWDSETEGLAFSYPEPETDYWIYLANDDYSFRLTTGLPADATHNATPAWDYRSRMFLSTTPNVGGYLSDTGCGLNARLVGRVDTDDTAMCPLFSRSVDISLISHTVNFPETYRDYSDYQIQFVDHETLLFALLDGEYGQIAVNRDLYYLGYDFEIQRGDPWIDWNDGDVVQDGTALSPNTIYYIYLPGQIDAFNFNEINTVTGRPWQAEDYDSATHYELTLDIRLTPFLSPKEADHGRMSDLWPGFECRHIGTVTTDANGYFINARDLSEIRQPPLNPRYFDGLAEIGIVNINSEELQVFRKKGTSGIVNVGGEAMQAYEQNTVDVHTILTSMIVQQYDEESFEDPLSPADLGWSPAEETWQAPVLDQGTAGAEGSAYRQIHAAASLTRSGSRVRITIKAGSSPLSLTHVCFAEHAGNGNAAGAFGSSKFKEAFFGGLRTVTVPAEESVTSDWLLFSVNDALSYMTIVSVAASNGYVSYATTGDGDYYKATAAGDYNVQTISGYTYTSAGSVAIANVEVSSSSNAIEAYAGQPVYIYMANSRPFWGDRAGRLVACEESPTGGYLSLNWPGNNARWVATLIPDAQGNFTGGFLTESIAAYKLVLDDSAVSLTSLWSSSKIAALLGIQSANQAAGLGWTGQLTNGLATRLIRLDSTRVQLTSVSNVDIPVIFPDQSQSIIPAGGVTVTVVGGTYTMLYVYLHRVSDTVASLIVSATAPSHQVGDLRLQWLGNDLLVGYCGLGASSTLPGSWAVYSFHNQDARTFTQYIGEESASITQDALVVPPIHSTSLVTVGGNTHQFAGFAGASLPPGWQSCTASVSSCPGYAEGEAIWYVPGAPPSFEGGPQGPATLLHIKGYTQRAQSHTDVAAGVYAAGTFQVTNTHGWLIQENCQSYSESWISITGTMSLSIQGN